MSTERLEVIRNLASKSPDGPMIEVGIYEGGSAEIIYEVGQTLGRSVYLYDTFSGIPWKDDIDSHQVGDFIGTLTHDTAKQCFPGANVIKGIFPREMEIPDGIGFAHLDVDVYKSYRESLDVLIPKMKKGGIILCDDYCLLGAAKAIDETPGFKVFLRDERVFFWC